MNLSDLKGQRGENLFTVLITKWCGGKPYFTDSFLGEKHETTDFLVELISPTCGHAHFYVQVKATTSNYSGTGQGRKLGVQVAREDVERLGQIHAPTYVVGIDIDNGRGYIAAVPRGASTAISGVPTKNALNCRNLGMLWKEVDDYWTAQKMLATKSRFSL
jgi:Domain of unknown function (DUF4365)